LANPKERTNRKFPQEKYIVDRKCREKLGSYKSLLLKAGFMYKPAKGSHTKWFHPRLPQSIIIPGKDSSDAKSYLEKQVNEALTNLKKLEESAE
jgi:predicted RNA binding protein YcfA (HicA-like mRNA interferase family)